MINNIKETIIRVIILFAGLVIAHLGVTLFLLADLGADPFNVLIQGLFRTAGSGETITWITHGRVHIVICFLIILVLLFVDRTYVRIGTVICMFFGGPIIDFFNLILEPVFADMSSIPMRVLVNVIGCVILAFGMTIVIKSEAGTGPNDLVAVVISDKSGKSFSIIRVIFDICFAGIGFILGGTLGIGTIICAFVVGPVAGVFMPINQKWIVKVVNRF